jgi:hypothetical protein
MSRPQDHSAAGRIRSIEKSSDLIKNRIRDLPACSVVPQPTTLPSASFSVCCEMLNYILAWPRFVGYFVSQVVVGSRYGLWWVGHVMHIDFSGESLRTIKLRYVLWKCFVRKGGAQNKLTSLSNGRLRYRRRLTFRFCCQWVCHSIAYTSLLLHLTLKHSFCHYLWTWRCL